MTVAQQIKESHMQIRPMLFAVAAVAGLAAGDAVARQPTFDEVMAIHKVLQGDGCDYVYLGMGERELYVTADGFEAVAKCADRNTYTYRFDGKFTLKEKTPKQG
jgi:hypothetical protein